MIRLTRILVPTDFGEASDSALKYAVALADAFKATLHIMHVLEDPVAHAWTTEIYVASLPGLYEELEKQARLRLDQLLGEAEVERLKPELVLRSGNPFLEIVRYAKLSGIDLIVMGTHGRGPVAHMLMGSVAEKVVRKAPCPVLTVRNPQHEFVMP